MNATQSTQHYQVFVVVVMIDDSGVFVVELEAVLGRQFANGITDVGRRSDQHVATSVDELRNLLDVDGSTEFCKQNC